MKKTLLSLLMLSVFGMSMAQDVKTTLDLADDAANANWGGEWRMPTYSELNELRTKCTRMWFPCFTPITPIVFPYDASRKCTETEQTPKRMLRGFGTGGGILRL